MRLSSRQRALPLSIWGVSVLGGVAVIFLQQRLYLLSAESKLVMLLGILTGGTLILASIRLLVGHGPPDQSRVIAATGVVLGVTLLLGGPLAFTPWKYEGSFPASENTQWTQR